MDRIKNAEIRNTFLGYEDHGIPTYLLQLTYGDGTQAFGMYDLRGVGCRHIIRILDTVGVKSWEELPGSVLRVKTKPDKFHTGTISAIGHFLKDEWFDPEVEGPEKGSDE